MVAAGCVVTSSEGGIIRSQGGTMTLWGGSIFFRGRHWPFCPSGRHYSFSGRHDDPGGRHDILQRMALGIIPSEDGMIKVEGVVILSIGGIAPSQGGTMSLEVGTNFTAGDMELGVVP